MKKIKHKVKRVVVGPKSAFNPTDHPLPDQIHKRLENANYLADLENKDYLQPKEILNIPLVKFPITNSNFPTNYPEGYGAELAEKNVSNSEFTKDKFLDTELDQLASKLNLQEEKRTLTSVAKLECKIAAATLKVLQANRELSEFKNQLVKEYEAQNIKLNNII